MATEMQAPAAVGSDDLLCVWRPIETALENTARPVVVGWLNSEGEEERCFDYKEDGCWMDWHSHAEHVEIIGGHGVSYTPPYTHWLDLPPIPRITDTPEGA